jgi:hypothetical protein
MDLARFAGARRKFYMSDSKGFYDPENKNKGDKAGRYKEQIVKEHIMFVNTLKKAIKQVESLPESDVKKKALTQLKNVLKVQDKVIEHLRKSDDYTTKKVSDLLDENNNPINETTEETTEESKEETADETKEPKKSKESKKSKEESKPFEEEMQELSEAEIGTTVERGNKVYTKAAPSEDIEEGVDLNKEVDKTKDFSVNNTTVFGVLDESAEKTKDFVLYKIYSTKEARDKAA